MAISSINIQTSTAHSFKHNDRTDKVTYLVDSSEKNEFNRGHKQAQNLLEKYIKEAENYRKDNGLRAMKSDTIKSVEAVVNLNASHTLEDVKKLASTIEKEFGFREVQIAIHRDEGKDSKNKNYHAHIVMCNLTPEGKTIQRTLGRDGLKTLQDITAKSLDMQRGKEGSEAERLEHKQYKAVTKQREAKENEIVALKTENKDLKYDFREYQKRITGLENESVEDKKELHRLNTQVKKGEATIQELEKRLQEALQSKKALETIKDTPKEEKSDFRPVLAPKIAYKTVEVKTGMLSSEKQEVLPKKEALALESYAEEQAKRALTLEEQNKRLIEKVNKAVELVNKSNSHNEKLLAENKDLTWYKEQYNIIVKKLKEYTGFEKITETIEAIKAKFLPTQEAKREEKPKSAFKQLEEDIAQIHKENPDIKAEVEQKPLKGKELMDEVQRLNEQGKKNMEYAKEQSKEPEKPKSHGHYRQ